MKSAYNNQTPGKYPKEYRQDSKHGESLKSRIINIIFVNEISSPYFLTYTTLIFVLYLSYYVVFL